MYSNVTHYSLGRFLLALCFAICLTISGSFESANWVRADGGGPDTITIYDSLLGGLPTEDTTTIQTNLVDRGIDFVSSTSQETLAKWDIKLYLLYWIQLTL